MPEEENNTNYTNNICQKCYHMQETCCSDSPHTPFTLQDIERLTALGHKLEDFAIAGEYPEEDFRGTEPWWEKGMIEIDGKFYKLNVKKKADGSCYFIDSAKGCTLGPNRPPVCKIFPFWLNEHDEIVYEEREEVSCFFQKRGTSLAYGMQLIGETPESIKGYLDEIRRDCVENNEQHRGLLLRLLKAKAE